MFKRFFRITYRQKKILNFFFILIIAILTSIEGFLALYNHHLTEAVIVEECTARTAIYDGYPYHYVLEYYTHDQKKIRGSFFEPPRKDRRHFPRKVGERFFIYYKDGVQDLLSSTSQYGHPRNLLLPTDSVMLSWVLSGMLFPILIFILIRELKIKIRFLDRIALKLNNIMKPKPRKVWIPDSVAILWLISGMCMPAFIFALVRRFKIKSIFSKNIALKLKKMIEPKPIAWVLDIRGLTNRNNEQADSAYSELVSILYGAGEPANFSPLCVDMLNNIPDGAVVLEKGDKFMQCVVIDINPDLRLFRTEYRVGDNSIDNPLYSTRYNETADITAKLFESFYLENNDYLHEARWEISEWFKEQHLK
jgi:hypothetical protein